WELQCCRTLIHQRLLCAHLPTTDKDNALRRISAGSRVQLGIKIPWRFGLDFYAHDSLNPREVLVLVIRVPRTSIAASHQSLRVAWVALELGCVDIPLPIRNGISVLVNGGQVLVVISKFLPSRLIWDILAGVQDGVQRLEYL